jgi:hypothetical protein
MTDVGTAPAKSWPADKVKRMSLAKLKPYPNNPRTHPESVVAEIMASVREFDVVNPIIVDDDGEIIAGHARAEAFRRLGFDKVPVIVAAGWTDAQKRSYRILDNSIPLHSDWDANLLQVELTKLELMPIDLKGFDLTLEGFGLIDWPMPDLTIPTPPPRKKNKHTFFVTVPLKSKDQAAAVIANALKSANIDYSM